MSADTVVQILNPLVYHSHALAVYNMLSSLTHHERGHTLHGLLLANAFSSRKATWIAVNLPLQM